MGWENPRWGRPYYTRSHRVGGRVVREYVGGGRLGVLAAHEDAERRRERAAEAASRQREMATIQALDAPVDELVRATDALVAQTMTAAGYHRHQRGAWRKRRAQSP